MIRDAIFWICCLPEFIACFILASEILLTSLDVWLASLGAKLFKPCITVLTVSLPAFAKLHLFKNPPRFRLLGDRLGLNFLGFFLILLRYPILVPALIFSKTLLFVSLKLLKKLQNVKCLCCNAIFWRSKFPKGALCYPARCWCKQLRNYLQWEGILLPENGFATNIFAWTEKMKKNKKSFLLIISKETVNLLKISLLREGTLMKLCKVFA